MSLRWKLFRFLSADQVLEATAGKETSGTFGESPLFPALSREQSSEQESKNFVLRRLCTAAERALNSDAVDGIFIFALPRGVAQLFNLAVVDNAFCLNLSGNHFGVGTPLYYSFSVHEQSVVATVLVKHADGELPSLVTLGIEENGPSVKIWTFKVQNSEQDQLEKQTSLESSQLNLSQTNTLPENNDGGADTGQRDHIWGSTREDNRLECTAVYRLQSESHPTSLSVMNAKAGLPGIGQIAVGFDNGSVTIFSGDILRERATRVRVAPAPGEMSEATPIVFTEYCGSVLYCVSKISVVVITPLLSAEVDSSTKKAPSFHRDILDYCGAANTKLCCTFMESGELVVAREEALYFYNRDGRGPCLAFPTVGKLASVSSAGPYLLHCSGPGSITAYDVVNKLIAYRGKGVISCSFPGHLLDLRTFLTCTMEGSMLKLSEISLEERVNMLLKRGLYVPAVNLARAESSRKNDQRKTMLTSALRQYAEYLMSKDRFDEAAEQLVETIGGNVEPSWVITRLVEQSGLRSGLRLYLEALHAAGKAVFVHTKVLITCYRHDRARGTILGSKAIEKTTDDYVINVFSDVDWTEEQVDAAIKLCRDAGLFKVAERVARRRKRYVQLARTLVEDLDEPDKALGLLRSLQDADASRVIHAVGRQLLVKDAMNFVHYLSEAICRSTATMPVGEQDAVLKLNDFLPMFIDVPRWRAVLLEGILGTQGGISTVEAPAAWVLLFESLVCVDVEDRRQTDGANEDECSTGEGDCASEETERRAVGHSALKVLQSRRSVIDLRAALQIAEMYGHEGCLEYLYEHLRMYRELGLLLCMAENGPALLRACRRHGEREDMLWRECIRLYAPLAAVQGDGSGENVTEKTDDAESSVESAQEIVEEAMLALDRSGVSGLEIVTLVTEACPSAGWGLVREYFTRCASSMRRDAAAAEHEGLLLERELKELARESKRLGEETVVMKPRTCSGCEDALSVPAVYFFCEHSFHAACLAATPTGREKEEVLGGGLLDDGRTVTWGEECPKCAPQLDAIVSMRQALAEKNEKHDEFFRKLTGSRDGFSTVMEILEKSPFL